MLVRRNSNVHAFRERREMKNNWVTWLCGITVIAFAFGVRMIRKTLKIPRNVRRAMQRGDTVIGVNFNKKGKDKDE